MLDRTVLITSLRTALPESSQIEGLADAILAAVADQTAAPQLTAYAPLLESLNSRQQPLVAGGTTLSFGVGNDQRGTTITIGDIAGNNAIKDNIVTINVPITLSTESQAIQNPAPNYGAQGVFHGPVTFNTPPPWTQREDPTMDSIPTGLRQYLIQHYNEDELRDLCFDLRIDYDSLPAIGKASKVRELILYCTRFRRIEELIAAAQDGRPAYTPSPASNPPIRTQPTPSTTSLNFVSCFISYSTKDEAFAKRLHSRMQQEHLRVWFAPEELKGGHKLRDQIDNAIGMYDKLLLILSDASMASDWVAHEVRRAYNREQKESKRVLFPIRLCDYESLAQWDLYDGAHDLALEVRRYFIPDFSNWKDHDAFEAAFSRLLRALEPSTEVQ